MPAHGRIIDKYTVRRRQELAARRKPDVQLRLPIKPTARKRTPAEQALALRQRKAGEILAKIRHLREPKPKPGQHPGKWTLAQDRALLKAVAAGVPIAELRTRIEPIRPGVTTGSCSHRFSKLARQWGVE